jgi:hypothetical protein
VSLDQPFSRLAFSQIIIKVEKLPLLIAQCQKRKKFKMKKYLILLLLLSPAAKANQVTPSWTNGSMNSTTNSTQKVVEVQKTQVYGGAYTSWTGTNIAPTAAINLDTTKFEIKTPGSNFQLEIVKRAAGVIEVTDINRTIDTTSTTTSLSVFSQ